MIRLIAQIGIGIAIAILASCGDVYVEAQQNRDSYGYATNSLEVSDIFFLKSSSVGWLLLEDHEKNSAFLLNSEDEGRTWATREIPKGIVRLNFINARLGWGLQLRKESGDGDAKFHVLRTTDGGKQWSSSAPIIAAKMGGLKDLAFANETHGWLVGTGPKGSGLVLETRDGGKTFREALGLPKSVRGRQGILVGEKFGVWLYGHGSVLRSLDEGRTWRESVDLQKLGTNEDSFDITSAYLSDSGRGWLAGQDPDGIILGTTDYGNSWKADLRTEESGNFWGISFWDKEHGCALGVYPVLLFCTSDSGTTWTNKDVMPPATGDQARFFKSLIMFKSGRGWALRGGGYLYETDDAGQSWHEANMRDKLIAEQHR